MAQFAVKTGEGEASVSVTPLPNLAGRDGMIVNMWREQVGQPPLDESQSAAALSPVEIAGEKGQIFEVNGTQGSSNARIITAMLHRPEASWFFKLSGPDAAVAAQKAAFVDFLKSVRIGEAGKGDAK
jgi:hypothetical protein